MRCGQAPPRALAAPPSSGRLRRVRSRVEHSCLLSLCGRRRRRPAVRAGERREAGCRCDRVAIVSRVARGQRRRARALRRALRQGSVPQDRREFPRASRCRGGRAPGRYRDARAVGAGRGGRGPRARGRGVRACRAGGAGGRRAVAAGRARCVAHALPVAGQATHRLAAGDPARHPHWMGRENGRERGGSLVARDPHAVRGGLRCGRGIAPRGAHAGASMDR